MRTASAASAATLSRSIAESIAADCSSRSIWQSGDSIGKGFFWQLPAGALLGMKLAAEQSRRKHLQKPVLTEMQSEGAHIAVDHAQPLVVERRARTTHL